MSDHRFVVVGIGADGTAGLTDAVRAELASATTIYGSARQLSGLTGTDADLVAWRSPMSEHLRRLLADPPVGRTHVLASGDPMFHGVGARIAAAAGPENVTVIPHVSSVSLAAARLGVDLSSARVVSLVTGPAEALAGVCSDGVELLILARDGDSAGDVAQTLTALGFGWSPMRVLSDLGADDEQLTDAILARDWGVATTPALSVISVSCVGPARSTAPGRDDDEYVNDGQLTKKPIRALTVSMLRPAPRQLLWDVGGGSGSIAIEWLQLAPGGRAIVFESDPNRRDVIAGNARRHGVGSRLTVAATAPEALETAPDPDTVFIGGGLSDAGVVAACWAALLPGGICVANAVTVESESVLVDWQHRVGGSLLRLETSELAPLGAMRGWRPNRPIVQWVATKPGEPA
ncbi:bifunctional cobalt-precorrin-7 (C(5))-methyltransferase/cobalt-precorrin-6B (C(15))-methyltransferase [Gordonia jinhuaensis]|uniref:Precorrin-6Y-methylase n=1 Tax=Gordonia jinhuaensis TaxID=1517702 RepID=A0A916WQ80_9ACTN|nr:precorrin-6y C5,15-methyltransferase (decarboxylating) subunit CbiE [Gordonia jinhuaensis]GGB24137.1 precorrin-6Y-methylase [Gordonia jinhuaensis]